MAYSALAPTSPPNVDVLDFGLSDHRLLYTLVDTDVSSFASLHHIHPQVLEVVRPRHIQDRPARVRPL